MDLGAFVKQELERLKLPRDLFYEVAELYINFRRDRKKIVTHFDQESVLKTIILTVARKNGYFVLLDEICNGMDKKAVLRILERIREYLGYPNYLNFSSEGYAKRVGQLLDIQYEELEKILNEILNNAGQETPVSILAKFSEYLNIEFSKLLKIRPTLTRQQINKYKKNI